MSIHEFVSSYDYMRDGGCIVVGKRDVNGTLTPTIILSNDTLTESERTTLALRLVKLLNVADHLKSETLLDGSPVALLHGHAANAYYGLTDELKDHTGLLIRMGLDNNATPGDIYAKVKNLLDLNAGSSSREQNFTAFCNNLHRLTGGITGHEWDAALLDKLLNHTRDKLGAPCQAIIDIAESYDLPCETWEKALEGLDAMLDELMRADAVPMSDGWGRLHDRLRKIDQTMSDIYEPVKVPTSPVHEGLVTASGAQAALMSNKAMWTCPSCGTLRDQVGMDNTPQTCGCGRFMHLDVYTSNTLAIEMPILDYAVCSAVLAAEGKPYPRTCAVHGLHTKCPTPRMHNWVRVPGFNSYEKCSGCGARSDSPVQLPVVCDGHLDF